MSLQTWHCHLSLRPCQGRVWILQEEFQFSLSLLKLSWVLNATKRGHRWNSAFHLYVFPHCLYFFISPHPLVNPGGTDSFFTLFAEGFWVSTAIFPLFWCWKLLIPNIFMWVIRKPWLSLMYRSGCAELAAACPKRVQKSEFAHFFLQGISLRINFLSMFSVCEEEK